ncbi:hypothetical protein F66182_10071 [Fusarium sp. NRRL 66182]|nr:hypothetical protein F66182_10071 [Fusarium sp. NRRL 66182]
MSEQNKPVASRIAIKFGAPSSNNSKKLSKPNPPSALGKRPRSHALGGGSDSEHDDDDDNRGRHEKITGFGADGAETERKSKDAKTEKKEYVIARQVNRDWRSDAKAQRRGTNLLPEEARAQQNGTNVETEPADQDKGLKWGLTIKGGTVEGDDKGTYSKPAEDLARNDDSKEPPIKRTTDDEAMDALLGNKEEDQKIIHPNEEDAYQRDIKEAGEASTLEDYEAMPVEEFGAALLRGMGWDGKPRGAVKEVKRRPNRLGLGAKELKGEEDLGGWNQNGKKNRRPRLGEYRQEEMKRKESRRHEDSYKRERERERDSRHGHRDRDRDRDRERTRDNDRHRSHHRDYDRRR